MSAKEKKSPKAAAPSAPIGGGKVAKSTLEGVHPVMHTVNVVMSDKSTFEIQTTWGKEGDSLYLDADPKNHPAWQEKASTSANSNNARVNAFNKKFGGFGDVVKKT